MTYILVFGLIWGLVCMNLAETRGRSKGMGFVGGFIFGIFGVIYYLIAGDTVESRIEKEENARKKYHRAKK